MIDIVISSLFFLYYTFRNVKRLMGIGQQVPWQIAVTSHVASGYLTASLATIQPVVAVIFFITFVIYEIVDGMKIDGYYSMIKDLASYAGGIVLWALKHGVEVLL